MAKRRRSSGKKRTLTPEQLQKMQEGKIRKQRQRERAASVAELEKRLRKGARSS